jgi:hypothetical protein
MIPSIGVRMAACFLMPASEAVMAPFSDPGRSSAAPPPANKKRAFRGNRAYYFVLSF